MTMMVRSDVERIAKVLKVNPQTIRRGLEQGAFPFGTAVKCEKRYSYILYPKIVREVLGIEIGEVEKGN